ncbi:MAG: hypothetical protein JST30_08985 [Armatimonadetes bacterium]|nr:hypothetical protein [Armatimonadota bacterium]
MKNSIRIFAVTALALAAMAPAMAQVGKTKTLAPRVAAQKSGTMKKPVAATNQVSGAVKGEPKGKTFVVASKKGTYTVDASKARCTYKGKFFSIGSLKGGTLVMVTGPAKGSTITATEVKVTYMKGAAKSKPTKAKMTSSGH